MLIGRNKMALQSARKKLLWGRLQTRRTKSKTRERQLARFQQFLRPRLSCASAAVRLPIFVLRKLGFQCRAKLLVLCIKGSRHNQTAPYSEGKEVSSIRDRFPQRI